jgi:hypothetical protein
MRTAMLSLGALLPLAFAFDARWIARFSKTRQPAVPTPQKAAKRRPKGSNRSRQHVG